MSVSAEELEKIKAIQRMADPPLMRHSEAVSRFTTRLELLKLTKPNADNPCMKTWIARATELEGWLNGAGQPSTEAQQKAAPLSLPLDRNNRQSPGPARK